jgi:hypothetical protein
MNVVPAFDRITVEPASAEASHASEVCGLLCGRVLEILATHTEREELFREYPFLEEEDLQQALRYAAVSVDDELRSLNRVA